MTEAASVKTIAAAPLDAGDDRPVVPKSTGPRRKRVFADTDGPGLDEHTAHGVRS